MSFASTGYNKNCKRETFPPKRTLSNCKRETFSPKKTLSLLDSQLTDTSSPSTFHCSDKIDFFYSPLLHSTLGLAGCWAASAAASQPASTDGSWRFSYSASSVVVVCSSVVCRSFVVRSSLAVKHENEKRMCMIFVFREYRIQ